MRLVNSRSSGNCKEYNICKQCIEEQVKCSICGEVMEECEFDHQKEITSDMIKDLIKRICKIEILK